MLIQENLTLQQKLEILSDAAKYDVACTSSGADRRCEGCPDRIIRNPVHTIAAIIDALVRK